MLKKSKAKDLALIGYSLNSSLLWAKHWNTLSSRRQKSFEGIWISKSPFSEQKELDSWAFFWEPNPLVPEYPYLKINPQPLSLIYNGRQKIDLRDLVLKKKLCSYFTASKLKSLCLYHDLAPRPWIQNKLNSQWGRQSTPSLAWQTQPLYFVHKRSFLKVLSEKLPSNMSFAGNEKYFTQIRKQKIDKHFEFLLNPPHSAYSCKKIYSCKGAQDSSYEWINYIASVPQFTVNALDPLSLFCYDSPQKKAELGYLYTGLYSSSTLGRILCFPDPNESGRKILQIQKLHKRNRSLISHQDEPLCFIKRLCPYLEKERVHFQTYKSDDLYIYENFKAEMSHEKKEKYFYQPGLSAMPQNSVR